MSIAVNPDEPFHVVHQGNVIAVSLEQLATAYQDDQVADETLIWQEGFEEWMRLDTLLHTLEEQDGPVSAAPELAEDMFYVMIAPEEVKQMSLDLLADAYRLDVIDDDTLVWQPSFTEWLPISALLGPEDAHVSIAPSMPPAYNSSYAEPAPVRQEAPVPAFNFSSASTLDDSLAPAADWSIIPQQKKVSPWYSRSLVALAALGSLFVLYRAGVMSSGADGPAPGSLQASVESKLGAPGVDTVPGLDRWLAQLEETHGLTSLSETTPVTTAKTPVNTDESTAQEEPKAEEPKTTAQAAATPEKPQQEASKKQESGAAASFSSSLSGTPKKVVKTTAPVRRQQRPTSSSTGTKWKGQGSAYDPMNGAL